MLDAHLRLRIGELDLDVELSVRAGEVVALLGPNGAGKTTVVRALAGLLPLNGGHVVLDGRTLEDPAAHEYVPTEQRPIGVVFQDYLLFPRMSVLDNIAFGLRARGEARDLAEQRALGWLERLGLVDLAGERPESLSGGQAQRVALARALAYHPRLLLLDEPLAALDATTRNHVRAELRRHLSTFDGARLLVTHDPLDALVLADRLVIIESGRITQRGVPAEVTARPATAYVADLLGINLLHGERRDDHTVAVPSGGRLTVGSTLPGGSSIAVAIRPQAVALHRQRPTGSPRNTWQGAIREIERAHDRLRVTLDGVVPLTAEITPEAAAALGLHVGDDVWAAVKAVDIDAYEA